MRPIKLTISAFGPYAKETEILLDELGERGLYLITGDTGAGKTTMVDLILGVLKPQAGKITVDGMDIKESYRGWHDKIGYIPQTIYMLDDTIRNNIAFGKVKSIDDAEIWAALKQAQLDEFVKSLDEGLDTMIGEAGVRLSGGQRQRIGIARALTVQPKLIIADEPVSALDVSIQAQVLNLLQNLQKEYNLTYLFISHDLSVVEMISDRIGVMYLGTIVETAPKKELYANPRHPYTRALLSAVPIPDPEVKKERITLKGDLPSPSNPPSGCLFHTRCPHCTEKCKTQVPTPVEIAPGHIVKCHYPKLTE